MQGTSILIILQYLVIIDRKTFGGEKDGEPKWCDVGSLSGESCKLSKGIVYFILCVLTLTVTSKINVYNR